MISDIRIIFGNLLQQYVISLYSTKYIEINTFI